MAEHDVYEPQPTVAEAQYVHELIVILDIVTNERLNK